MAKRAVSPNAFYVYILFRHDTGQPFYVGKGHGDRWNRSDKARPRDTNRHKRAIIHLAQKAGAEIPKVKIASNLTETEAFEVERVFIAAIGRQHVGGPLTNLTDGGDGESGRIISAEQRENMSKARKGRKLSAEWRAKIGASQKGQKHTPEHTRRMADAQRGKKRLYGWWSSEEGRAKQKANNKGHSAPHSEETRAKISKALKLKGIRPRTGINIGRVASPETRAKLSAAITQVWARRRAQSLTSQQ